MSRKEPVIIFDDSVKSKIIEALGYKKEGANLVDEEGKVVTSMDYEEITYKNFGGVLKGSQIPVKKEDSDIAKYFVNRMK